MRTLDTKVNVLRDGAKIAELSPIDIPNIQMNGDAEIKSSMTGTFLNNDKVDWLRDVLQPIAIINDVEHHLGVFLPATITNSRDDSGFEVINVSAYDRCWLLQATKTEDILHLSAGTNYMTAIETLLIEAGVSMYITIPTVYTLRTDREDWEIGTDYLTIVNQLLREINYKQIYFNADGWAILEPEPLLDVINAKYSYDYNSIESLMFENSSKEIDLFNAPNVFICVCSNPDDNAIMKAVAENTSAISPLSIMRRGRRISEFYQVDNIASQAALEEYAALLCQNSMLAGETITINTGILPGRGINDVVALSHPDSSGLCIEFAWNIQLTTGGNMSHTLRKAVVNI